MGATKSGSRICALSAEGAREPVVCRVREKGWRFAHHPAPNRTGRAPHYAEQVGNDLEQAEGQTEGRIPGGVLATERRAFAPEARSGCRRVPPRKAQRSFEPDVLQSFVAIYRLNFSGFRQKRANAQRAENPRVYWFCLLQRG